MRFLKFLAVLVASAGVVALVFVYGPSVSGQRADAPDRHAHEMLLSSGGAGELGVAVRNGDAGVVIEEVRPGGAGEKGGLKRGDLVVDFNGERVHSARQFTRLVSEAAPDRPVKTTVQRDGKRTELQITPAERSAGIYIDPERLRERIGDVGDMVARLPLDMNFDLPGWRPRLGVTVQELTPQLEAYFATKGGVLVSSVADDSAAAKAGLKAGDVITAIDGRPVDSRMDVTRRLRDADGDVDLTVVRDRKEMTLKAKIEGRPRTSRRH